MNPSARVLILAALVAAPAFAAANDRFLVTYATSAPTVSATS